MIEIRAEAATDRTSIRSLNEAAFEDTAEASIIDRLRATCDDYVSFVATENETVVGHILFTPVTCDDGGQVGMGLAPMAVSPLHQRKGVGSRLVRHGMEHLRERGCHFIIVLGHPEYYPRFGFRPASRCGLKSQWDGVPDEAFMVIVFDGDGLPADGGVVRYRAEFDDAM